MIFPGPVVSVAAMREADRRCIEELGIPGAVLMERAGIAVFEALPPGSVGVVCGTGNNGGDGFVVARHALLAGRTVEVVLVGDPERVRGDAAIFLRAYRRLGGAVRVARNETEAHVFTGVLLGRDVVVDALLGTGFSGEARGLPRAAIEAWPPVPTVSVDVPSGLDADTGETGGVAIRADTTVTFQFAKRGFANPAAAPYLGRVVVADIGIPEVCANDAAWAALRDGAAWDA